MFRIEKFNNFETTTIHIEMNISLIIIWGMCFPKSYFRVQFLHSFPNLQSVSVILRVRLYIQKMKRAKLCFFFCNNYCATDSFSANLGKICFGTVCIKGFFNVLCWKNCFIKRTELISICILKDCLNFGYKCAFILIGNYRS